MQNENRVTTEEDQMIDILDKRREAREAKFNSQLATQNDVIALEPQKTSSKEPKQTEASDANKDLK